MNLADRVAATQATLDEWKGQPFTWGRSDCGSIVTSHLVRMGHLPTMPGDYSSALGAKKALKAMGFKTLAAAMDANGFERIAPAAALAGDVIELEGEGIGALVVAVGNGRVLGFHQDTDEAVVMQPARYLGAWRV